MTRRRPQEPRDRGRRRARSSASSPTTADGTGTEASLIGSIMAGGVVLPIVAGVLALAAAALRQWRVAAFFVFALAVESAAYRTTTLVVHRHRPRCTGSSTCP